MKNSQLIIILYIRIKFQQNWSRDQPTGPTRTWYEFETMKWRYTIRANFKIGSGSWIPGLNVILKPFCMSLFALSHPSVRYKTFSQFVRCRPLQMRLLMNLLRAGLHNTLLYKTQVLIKVEVRSNLQTSHFLAKISPIWPETYLLLM